MQIPKTTQNIQLANNLESVALIYWQSNLLNWVMLRVNASSQQFINEWWSLFFVLYWLCCSWCCCGCCCWCYFRVLFITADPAKMNAANQTNKRRFPLRLSQMEQWCEWEKILFAFAHRKSICISGLRSVSIDQRSNVISFDLLLPPHTHIK